MTPRENYLAFFRDEPYEWIPMAGDVKTFRPEELHDNVARGFVNQQEPFPPEKFGGKGWFNVEWKYEYEVRGAIGVGRVLDDVSEWREKLVWPDLDASDWAWIAKKNADYLKTDQIIQTTIFTGFFERLISLMDFTDAAMALVDPDVEDDVKELFDKLADLYIDYAERNKRWFNVEFLELHDDWGNQRSAMMSLDTHTNMILPYVKKVVDACHDMGMIFFMHSCGNVTELFPNFIEAGIDTWSGQEMGIKWPLVQKYGDRFKFAITLMPPKNATADEVREYVQKQFDQYKDYKVHFRAFASVMPKEHFEIINEMLKSL